MGTCLRCNRGRSAAVMPVATSGALVRPGFQPDMVHAADRAGNAAASKPAIARMETIRPFASIVDVLANGRAFHVTRHDRSSPAAGDPTRTDVPVKGSAA